MEPLFQKFEQETGIRARVRYGDTAELAATLLEEGDRSPADLFFAQDAGALALLSAESRFQELPPSLVEQCPEAFRSPGDDWIGISGRARVLVYSTERVEESRLPGDISELLDPEWKGRLGWAPANASFQSFVTALRRTRGEELARAWLEGMKANQPKEYPRNTPALQAVLAGEIDAALLNHYYLHGLQESSGEVLPAENHYFSDGIGSMMNVAGAGILTGSRNREEALRLLEFLLGPEAQSFFAMETFEYPLSQSAEASEKLPELPGAEERRVDLGGLEDLRGTMELLRSTGILP